MCPPDVLVHKSIVSRLGAFRPNETMSSIANARDQLRAANDALKASRRELCQLHKNGVPGEALGQSNRVRCPATLDTVLRIFAVCGMNEDAALQYVSCKRRHLHQRDCVAPGELVGRWNGMSAEQQAHFMDETVPGTKRQMQEAQQFVKERSLQQWLRDQNINKGLAPTADNVYRKWRHLQRSLSPARMAELAPAERKTRSRVQWARRWSRRFAHARGRFNVGSRLPLPLARDKVRCCTHKLSEILVPLSKNWCTRFQETGPKTAPSFRAPKQGRTQRGNKNEVQNPGPK